MEKKFCKTGGAYRSESGYLEEVCEFCLRDMPYGEKDGAIQQLDDGSRICEGRCSYDCDYTIPYGFVPESDCPIHDRPKEIPMFKGTFEALDKLTSN